MQGSLDKLQRDDTSMIISQLEQREYTTILRKPLQGHAPQGRRPPGCCCVKRNQEPRDLSTQSSSSQRSALRSSKCPPLSQGWCHGAHRLGTKSAGNRRGCNAWDCTCNGHLIAAAHGDLITRVRGNFGASGLQANRPLILQDLDTLGKISILQPF